MSETDLDPLPTSKMDLAVTIINDFPTYAKSPVLARALPHLSSITHYCYLVKSPSLAIVFLSLLYVFVLNQARFRHVIP